MFIPKKIKVGYQDRSGTYTGKLAYVIYYDEAGKLRKETSWNGWRDEKIEPDDYDNVPTSGFVLNKKVGGYSTGWNHRSTYTRVYDPRGFEFEITVDNLLYILENCNSIKGKGLEGEFVYGWDGKDLILIPVSSPDYIAYKEKTDLKYNAEYFKGKDLKLGLTYETLNGERYIYLGKYNYYEEKLNHCRNRRYSIYGGIDMQWAEPLNETWLQDPLQNSNTKSKFINKGKRFFFAKVNDNKILIEYGYNKPLSSVSKKFYRVANENIHPKLSEMIEYVENQSYTSPVVYSKTDIIDISLEKFRNNLLEMSVNDKLKFISKTYNGSMYYQQYNRYYGVEIEKKDEAYSYWSHYTHSEFKESEIDKLLNDIKPVRITRYLENGNIENIGKGEWNLYE